MPATDLYLGLISGTSVDAADCVLASFQDDGKPQLHATHSVPIASGLRRGILALCSGEPVPLAEYGAVDVELGELFARGVEELLAAQHLAASAVRAIGSHGQTVFHHPHGCHPATLQLGDPNVIAQRTGITTVADLRRRDLAAGGQGAPLAPLLHRAAFASTAAERVILNLGGMANITVLRRDGSALAFDTGPANVLLDHWAERHLGRTFDEGGEWAASGAPHPALLRALLAEPYFQQAPPKSTGRERFNGAWLASHLQSLDAPPAAADVQATLLELTAASVTAAIASQATAAEVYACGGGVRNRALMGRLGELLPQGKIASTTALGLAPDWVEATAFALLAREALADRPQDTSAFTGARQPVRLGGIYRA